MRCISEKPCRDLCPVPAPVGHSPGSRPYRDDPALPPSAAEWIFRSLKVPAAPEKSALLRMVAGLDRPDTGEILVNGQPVQGPGKDRGMVFQKYTSLPWLTVKDNIGYE